MKTPMSLNGVDLGQLNDRIETITNDPGMARQSTADPGKVFGFNR